MRRFGMAAAGLAIGYVVGALIGWMAVAGLSANRHDRSQEATMAAAFVTGPICGVVGIVFGLLIRRRRS